MKQIYNALFDKLIQFSKKMKSFFKKSVFTAFWGMVKKYISIS